MNYVFFFKTRAFYMTPDIQTKLAAMIERIVAGFKPERIILFGSNARGTAGSDSDVDLIIVMPTIESKRRIRLAIREAVSGMGLSKDILVYSPEEMEQYRHLMGSLVHSAWREGIDYSRNRRTYRLCSFRSLSRRC